MTTTTTRPGRFPARNGQAPAPLQLYKRPSKPALPDFAPPVAILAEAVAKATGAHFAAAVPALEYLARVSRKSPTAEALAALLARKIERGEYAGGNDVDRTARLDKAICELGRKIAGNAAAVPPPAVAAEPVKERPVRAETGRYQFGARTYHPREIVAERESDPTGNRWAGTPTYAIPSRWNLRVCVTGPDVDGFPHAIICLGQVRHGFPAPTITPSEMAARADAALLSGDFIE